MIKKSLLILIVLVLIFGCLSYAQAARLTGVGTGDALTKKSGEVATAEVIGGLLKIGISVVGAVAFIVFVYGGVTWLSSAGNSSKITQGKSIVVWATIGLVVVLFSYAITDFIIYALTAGYSPADRDPFGPAVCSNGEDDDGDTLVDLDDPGCDGPNDDDEYNPPPPDTCEEQCIVKSGTVPTCADVPRDPTQQPLIDGTGECARSAIEAGITMDNFICCKEPPPPPICGGSLDIRNKTGEDTKIVDMYVHKGKLGLARDFMSLPDKLSLYCDGDSTPFFTTGFRQCRDTHTVEFDCPSTTKLKFEITSLEKAGTKWCLMVVCDPSGPITNNCQRQGDCPCSSPYDTNKPLTQYCVSGPWSPPACPADRNIQCDAP